MRGVGGAGDGGIQGQRQSAVEALRRGTIQGDEARLRAASDALESAFFQELFKAMRETVPDSGLLGGGGGEDGFITLMDQHLSEVAAMQSEKGIGQALYRWFSREREG
jgi:Rod binding domain-containing protein